MSTLSLKTRSALATSFACCAFALASVGCGFSNGTSGGSAGTSGSSAGSNGSSAGSNGETAGSNGSSAGSNGETAGSSGSAGNSGSAGTNGSAGTSGSAGNGTGGTTSTGGTTGAAGVTSSGWKNYEVTASMPHNPIAVVQKPGTLKYTKIVIQDQFLAESCSIGDYNGDGIPDVSSGRIWYEGTNDPTTTFKTQHPFRDGHGPLPRAGAGPELNTGVSDDWADYPWDMDGDGDTDIINIAQCDVPEANSGTLTVTGGPNNVPPAAGTPNKIGTVQVHATAVWYENPGKGTVETQTTNWAMHLMHSDVRNEQHEIVDMNGDGYPEIVGACRDCVVGTIMGDTKGYYQGDPKNPTALWTYHGVTPQFTFPFGNLGWMHGMGAGDVNGDGLPDWMDRRGVWLQQPGGTWNSTPCTGKNTPAGCGWIQQNTPLLAGGFYDGLADGAGNKGASHMFAVDMDMDGCTDVVAADWAHGHSAAWYQQQKDGSGACTYAFKKFYFMGDAPKTAKYNPSNTASLGGASTLWGAGFTEPHSFQVYDMDGDGRPDVIAGKMRFAHPYDQNDADPDGVPYIYVFKNVAAKDPNSGGPITLQPVLVDGDPTQAEGTQAAGMGVGRQIAIGHVNTDGIMDICVGTKLGLAVFLGQ
jgi:hypothetical protein